MAISRKYLISLRPSDGMFFEDIAKLIKLLVLLFLTARNVEPVSGELKERW